MVAARPPPWAWYPPLDRVPGLGPIHRRPHMVTTVRGQWGVTTPMTEPELGC